MVRTSRPSVEPDHGRDEVEEVFAPPKQRRSRETFEKILDACEELLKERRFDEISTGDLCDAADVSPSSIYARFPAKEAVLLALVDRHALRIRELFNIIAESIDKSLATDKPGEFARILVSNFVRFVRDYNHLHNAFELDARASERLKSAEEDAAVGVAEFLKSLFLEADPPAARRVDFAINACSAITHRAVGAYVAFADDLGMSDEELTQELTVMMGSYLLAPIELD